MQQLQFGELVAMNDGSLPAKLMKALAVIGYKLHPLFDENPCTLPGVSRHSCILSALAVRDFLRRVGIAAEVRSVAVVMRLDRGERTLHSLGIGVPGTPKRGLRWAGHLIVEATESRTLIDPTIGQARRNEHWSFLPEMIAIPRMECPEIRPFDLEIIGFFNQGQPPQQDEFNCGFCDYPQNDGWRLTPDAGDYNQLRIRNPVVDALVDAFGTWRDA